ncbi:MAG: hypothetical protein IPP90_14100 [Gemmatimonadaceae bacterium]|nr:hypothetical protein [Gemmatimonadaceae bacterium]
MTFTATGLSGASANVTLTAGLPTSITVVAGNSQTATIGTAVPVAPSVRVTDLDANFVTDRLVTFAVTGGGGSLTGANQFTDDVGVARVGTWILGTTTSGNAMTANVGSLAGPASLFTATGTGRPASCGVTVFMTVDIMTAATLSASPCLLQNAPTFMIGGNPFFGSQGGGTYFYDRYLIDIPAGAIVRFEVTESFSNNGFGYFAAYMESGAFVAYEAGFGALTVNNNSAAVRRYQIILTASGSGVTGAYTMLPRRIL